MRTVYVIEGDSGFPLFLEKAILFTVQPESVGSIKRWSLRPPFRVRVLIFEEIRLNTKSLQNDRKQYLRDINYMR